MSQLKWIALGLVLLLVVLFKLPLNRFIPEQTGDALLSIIQPVTLWSGQGYFQVRGEPDVWHFDYKFCSVLSWCVQLSNGANQFESKVSSNGSGVKLSELTFRGDNQALRDIVPPNMASFDLTASADEVLIPNLVCPSKGVEVINGVANVSNINVLGNSLQDINASVLDNNQEELTIIATGGVDGQLNVRASSYTGRFKAVNLPASLTAILPPQEIASGWAVSGKLSCGA